MNYFLSIKAANAEIETLRAKLAAAEASAIANVEESTRATALLKERDDAAAELHAKLVEASARVTTLEAEAKDAGTRAANIVAGMGVKADAVPADPGPKAGAKTMKRFEFSKLSPTEQALFCRNGGKLTE